MWDGVQGPNEREVGNFSKFDTSHEGSALTHRVSAIAVGRGYRERRPTTFEV